MAGGLRSPQVLPLLLALVTTFAPEIARAQTPERRARLEYSVTPDTQGCPSEGELRAAANARAGHELFGEPASLTLEVHINRVGAGHVATVVMPDAPGGTATRELRSDVGCAELATAVALVASLAIDPESALSAPPAPPPPPPPPPPPSRTWRGWIGLGPRVGIGPGPVSGGVALSAGLVGARGTLGAELRGLAPRDTAFAEGHVSVLPLTLLILPCAARGHWEACGVVAGGLVRGEGSGFAQNLTAWQGFAALGARGGLILGGQRLRMRAFVEAAAVFPRTLFDVEETSAYTTRGVSLAGGVDGLLFF